MRRLVLPHANMAQSPMANQYQTERGQKNHPAGKLVQKSLRRCWSEVPSQHAGPHDSNRVRHDGNWNDQNNERIAGPAAWFGEIAV